MGGSLLLIFQLITLGMFVLAVFLGYKVYQLNFKESKVLIEKAKQLLEEGKKSEALLLFQKAYSIGGNESLIDDILSIRESLSEGIEDNLFLVNTIKLSHINAQKALLAYESTNVSAQNQSFVDFEIKRLSLIAKPVVEEQKKDKRNLNFLRRWK